MAFKSEIHPKVLQHRELDQLVHNLSENCFYEPTFTSNKLSSECWYSDATKSLKIREIIYIRISGRVIEIITNQYNKLGNIEETYSETIIYNGNRFESLEGELS